MKRTKEQILCELRRANGMIAQMAEEPRECNNCLSLQDTIDRKEKRIDTMIHNIQKFMKENGLLKKLLKEIL
jgi:hypothetical protein